jgi:hypothetical protein
MTASYERPLVPGNVLRLFRQRYNTWDIAKMYSTNEPRVERALHEALAAEQAAGMKRRRIGSACSALGRLGPEG